MKAALVLATQLFEQHPAFDDPDIDLFLFIESDAAFRRRPYHSHKLVLLLAAMRHAVDELDRAGRRVERIRLGSEGGFLEGLRTLVHEHDVEALAWMSATDRGIDRRLLRFCADEGLRTRVYDDALFLTPASKIDEWFALHRRARGWRTSIGGSAAAPAS